MKKQTTDTLLMIRPDHFGFNPETAENNVFQDQGTGLSAQAARQRAQREFDNMVAELRDAGLEVIVVRDADGTKRPDAVFPNNWITFHDNGTIITYPMYAANRRVERRDDIIDMMRQRFGVKQVVRFEGYETSGQFLEGTGSMVLDRENRIIYACLSPRTDADLLEEFAQWAEYEKVAFHALDEQGEEIYHTNVMMALGDTFAVVCLDSVAEPGERRMLEERLRKTGKEVIPISMEQMMRHFAGNMLQVRNKQGETILVMSEKAYRSLSQQQIESIEKHSRILHCAIPTIEQLGGGSVRCMMAEVFLPTKA